MLVGIYYQTFVSVIIGIHYEENINAILFMYFIVNVRNKIRATYRDGWSLYPGYTPRGARNRPNVLALGQDDRRGRLERRFQFVADCTKHDPYSGAPFSVH